MLNASLNKTFLSFLLRTELHLAPKSNTNRDITVTVVFVVFYEKLRDMKNVGLLTVWSQTDRKAFVLSCFLEMSGHVQ